MQFAAIPDFHQKIGQVNECILTDCSLPVRMSGKQKMKIIRKS